MTPTIVLLHSPFVGPLTWQPVHTQLTERGYTATLPSLVTAAQSPAPIVPRIIDTSNDSLAELPHRQPVILVAHSNAGLFVPAVTAQAPRHIPAAVFVDAALPTHSDAEPTTPPLLAQALQDKIVDGLLPVWTDWFDADDVASLFPDPQTQQAVAAEQPRLPGSYCHEHVPVPHGWHQQRPYGYLQFSEVYDEQAHQARRHDWLVRQLPGQHLHQLVDPAAVTDKLLNMVNELVLMSA